MSDRPPVLDLSHIRIVDQHAHNLLRPECIGPGTFQAAFTEGSDSEIVGRHVQDTLFFRRSLRDLAPLLGCEADLESVQAARQRLGFDEVARRCFAASNLETVLLDDGFMAAEILPVAWHGALVRTYRLLRVEHLAEELIRETAGWDDFRERFCALLEHPPAPVVGFKSIVAYRSGLAVEPADDAAAATCYQTLRANCAASPGEEAGSGPRLACKPLNDWVVWRTLKAAARNGLPVQLHTGFGDPDLDLRLADPLHLRPLLEQESLRGVRFVLLHASYPFTRHAGYLAAVYPNVYVDFGLAIPTLSVAGMRWAVRSLLELAPLGKILYSSDAHVIPELFYLGALWGRRILARELQRTVDDGDLTRDDAEEAAEMILRGNALGLYHLSAEP